MKRKIIIICSICLIVLIICLLLMFSGVINHIKIVNILNSVNGKNNEKIGMSTYVIYSNDNKAQRKFFLCAYFFPFLS